VDLGACLREFLHRLGLDASGGPRGNCRAMRVQLQALAACRMSIGLRLDGRAVTVKTDGPVQQYDAWLSGEQRHAPMASFTSPRS
jgi:hypothetical protein